MKKIILFLLLFATFTTTPAFTQDFYGGTGTEDDPFLISTPQHLDNIRKYVGRQHADKHFLIINEIDLDVPPYNGPDGWIPIGGALTPGDYVPFYGKLHGYMNGLCGSGNIKNLKLTGMHDKSASLSALFAVFENGAVIKNIGFENCTINTNAARTGTLVGFMEPGAIVENCYVIGNITSEAETVGGIIGGCRDGSIVKNCYSVCEIINTLPNDYAICGVSVNASILTNCYSKSNLTINEAHAGLVTNSLEKKKALFPIV